MTSRTVAPSFDPDEHRQDERLRVEFRRSASALHLTFCDLAVDRADIVPLREALGDCSPDELLMAVLRHEAGWRIQSDALESRTYAMLMRRVTDALDGMMEGEAREPVAEREVVIGPLWCFLAGRGGRHLEHSMGAALYSHESAHAGRALLAEGVRRVCTWDELREVRRHLDRGLFTDDVGFSALKGSIVRLSHMSWDEALALPIWLPGDLSDRERYAVLAKVFWAMTYRGFSREEQERTDGRCTQGQRGGERHLRLEPWPVDPVHAVLDHNCWVDALEMQDALFAMLPHRETCL